MSASVNATSRLRHPWLDRFAATPEAAFGELLAGYADITPYQRADAPDAARMLFGPLAADDPARAALGPAIMAWLGDRRLQHPPKSRPQLQRFVREISEAFEIVAALDVGDAARSLRLEFARWDEWTARLVLSPARDARAAYWRMLALTQDLTAPSGSSLVPFWLRICREAGDVLPAYYLAIGLLGLRRLEGADQASDAPWLAGLGHWALARQPSDDAFKAEWFALKPLYPRPPDRWRTLVSNLLAGPAFAGIEPPGWWRLDDDFKPLLRPDARRPAPLRSPMPEEMQAIVAELGQPFERIEPRICDLMVRHRRFRDRTGDSRFFVRAAHGLGKALIERGDDAGSRRAKMADSLAREGLEWEPGDKHLRALWRDALAARGVPEAAELVGWDFIRREPDAPEARTQLATLVADRLGRPAEAETLLRDTIGRFPENAVARTQLATLLADRLGRPAEAEALLRDTIVRCPGNAVARNQLAELLIDTGWPDAAAAVVNAAIAAGAVDASTYAVRARLLSNRGRDADARQTVADGLARFPTDNSLQQLRRLLESEQQPDLHRRTRGVRPGFAEAGPPPSAWFGRSPGSHAGATGFANSQQPFEDPDPMLAAARQQGKLRRLRFILETGDADARARAQHNLDNLLRSDPNAAYAGLLGSRYRLWNPTEHGLPGFAAAFEYALAEEDRQTLEALAQSHPRLRALTLVARAALGDLAAPVEVERWLRDTAPLHEAPPLVVLRRGLMPVLSVIDGGRTATAAFAETRAVVMRVLHDVNEAALAA